MSARTPNSKFIILALSLFLFLGFFIRSWASDTVTVDDDMEGFEELLALDEEEEKEGSQAISSEAEAVSKAQRIVLELSNDNTRRIIDDHKFVLVLGYAPWCVRSAELMPQFSEAATTLKEMGSPLLLAKLDAERYPKAASLLEIKGFPTMLLFVNGSSQVYTGGFSAQEIVIWARKKTGEPVIRINSATEAEEFLKKNRMFVIGLFGEFEGPEYKEFVDAATTENEIQFAETSSIEVAKILFPDVKFNKPFMGLVKGELERYATFEGSFRKDKILEFLEYNKFPLVSVLTELNSVRVYSSPIKLQVFVFAGAVDFKNFLVTLQDIARKFKSKIMFIYIDVAEENLAKPFLTLFGIEETEKTIVAAFDNKISSKYLLESDPTSSNIEEFCSGLLHGTLLPYFKSESIPDNKGALVQKVVGKTFDELVLSNPNNVLLEVHTPWCINCETTSKQIERLAKHFKGLDNLTIARFDASANEHPKLQIDDYPTLLFYPHNEKSNPIKLPPKSSIKELAMFINKNVRAAEDEGTQTQSQGRKDEL